ncbi:NUDIX hydrolase, partial [bacterium]|nr:NUDIX hydrolase [bacterium]
PGRLAAVFCDRVRLPDGSTSTREFIRHPGAAAMLPLYENGDLILIRQFRYPVGKVLWEIPAGKLSCGEDPLTCARRELQEETGFTATDWQPLFSYYPCIGYSDEEIHLYLATGLQGGATALDQGEFLTSHRVTPAQVHQLLINGTIVDGKTRIALQWLLHRYPIPGTRSLKKDG